MILPLSQALNPGLLEYEAGVVASRLRFSVMPSHRCFRLPRIDDVSQITSNAASILNVKSRVFEVSYWKRYSCTISIASDFSCCGISPQASYHASVPVAVLIPEFDFCSDICTELYPSLERTCLCLLCSL